MANDWGDSVRASSPFRIHSKKVMDGFAGTNSNRIKKLGWQVARAVEDPGVTKTGAF